MCEKRYKIKLTDEERQRLNELIRKGKSPAKIQLKARILLKADEAEDRPSLNDTQIAEALETTAQMAYRTRRTLVEEGMDAVLTRKKREVPPTPRIFDGDAEARLLALACSKAPEGYARWTLTLLADKAVELEIVERVSRSTVGLVLKKTKPSPISSNSGCFRRKQTARS